MTRCRLTSMGFALVLLFVPLSRADEFDRIEGDALARLAKEESTKSRTSLTDRELDRLPSVLKDTRSAFLVVKTGQGNYARVLASPALRKATDGDGPAVPVLVLERFDTFEPGKSGSRLARGAGVILFEGFQIDLDSGQIVPAGQGGDLEFRKAGDASTVLKALDKSTIYTATKPIVTAANASGPSPGKTILPGDFAGRYRLHADGRWSGLVELQVDSDRQITGRFRSEPNGTSYPVTGQVSADQPQKAVFTVKFPRSEQAYDAYLWTEGKNVIAGTFTMLERTFGFVAVREGTKIGPLD